jgi:hypothetical protein
MHYKNYYFIFFILCFCLKINAQEIKGVLLDSISQEPIIAAHVSLKNKGIGTISNENGEFSLVSTSKTDTLHISHIGYQSLKIPFESISIAELNTYYLLPDMVVLNEVVVGNDVVSGIVGKVMAQLEKSPIRYGKAFYQQTAFKGEKPTEWIEAFYDLSYSKNGVNKIKIDQARFARTKYDKKSPFLTFTNFSYFTVATNLFSSKTGDKENRVAKPFSQDFIDDYIFYLSSSFQKQNDIYYVITYEPKETNKNLFNSYGSFVYNTSKEQLVKYSAFIDHSLGVDEITSYKGDKKIEVTNPKYTMEISFSDTNGSLEFISNQFNYDFVQDDEVFPSKVQSSFVFYQKLDKEPKNLREAGLELENVSNFENAKYRPRFWKENPVIKLTAEEEAIINFFEKENAFGTYFK